MPKILVCGGRDFPDRDLVFRTLDAVARKHGTETLAIIHGACLTGADKFAEEWAKEREVAYIGFPARWKTEGRAAGPLRNKRMRDATSPDHCIAFRGDRGTRGMIALMREIGIEPWLVGWSE
jgi:hypothetical protein